MTTKKELDPIDKHLDVILRASGTTLANFETSAGALQGMRAALLAAVAELAPAGAASANHFPGAAKMVAGDAAMKTALIDGAQAGPVLLTDDALVEINLHVAMNEVADSDGSREIVIKHGRSIEAAVHAANQAPANLEWSKGGEITKIDERVQRSRAAFYALQKDAERYRLVRRGQHWSVIDGAGDALRAEELDVAADAVIAKAASQEGGAS